MSVICIGVTLNKLKALLGGAVEHQEKQKTCEVITPYGVITQFPKNGRLFTPKYRLDHAINI
jgi:hypothetical protein